MSFISCLYPFKYQKDGYCLKTHVCPPSKYCTEFCLFFEPGENVKGKKEKEKENL